MSRWTVVPFNEKGKKNWEGIGWGLRDQGSIWRHIKFKMLSFDLSGGQVKQTLGSLTQEQVWLEIWFGGWQYTVQIELNAMGITKSLGGLQD